MTALVVIGIVEAVSSDDNEDSLVCAAARATFPAGFSTLVSVSKEAAATKGTSAALFEGEKASVWELLHAMMLPSGNDAAVALAEAVGVLCAPEAEGEWRGPWAAAEHYDARSYKRDCPFSRFVAEMNRTARALGLRSTHFVNPHGLMHPAHASTALDVAALVHAAMANARFRQVAGAREYKRAEAAAAPAAAASARPLRGAAAPPRPAKMKNINILLGDRRVVPGCTVFGVKTGITPEAGSCLALLATSDAALTALHDSPAPALTPDGPVYLSVVLGSESKVRRFIDSQSLLQWAAASVSLLDCGEAS
jgi:D-alanyl-D-alanine carboxypeptidase